jgi:hypothetical protein
VSDFDANLSFFTADQFRQQYSNVHIASEFHQSLFTNITLIRLRGFSPQANYTDRSLSAKLVPTLADREGVERNGSPRP